MTYADLLSSLGFEHDPFAKTNADEEEYLDRYFIPPPFFNAVFGDPKTPKSAVVFAPRGGGKTALKRKIEILSQYHPILCVTYNQFDVSSRQLADITFSYHLDRIIRLVLVALLTAIKERGIGGLKHQDRHVLFLLVRAHLSKLDRTELKKAIKSAQNFSDQAKSWWDKFTGPIGMVLNAFLQKVGLSAAEIAKFEKEGGSLGDRLSQLSFLKDSARLLGYESVYVLVDKVDETGITGLASSSFQFISPLITDLHLLELEGFGFKFFLWDALLDEYRDVSRPDRVKYYALNWKEDQLRKMLEARLKAHSRSMISLMGGISEVPPGRSLDDTVVVMAQGSPRNVIRICKAIVDQQSEISSKVDRISRKAVEGGFNSIATDVSEERFREGVIRDLQRNKRCDFTIRHVYSEVFKFTQQAGLNKVRTWLDAGAVEQVGTIKETRGARTANHYAVADIMLGRHLNLDLPFWEFLTRKLQRCPDCSAPLLRDWDLRGTQLCHHCQSEIVVDFSHPKPTETGQLDLLGESGLGGEGT